MFKTTLQQSRMEELFVEIVIANQQSQEDQPGQAGERQRNTKTLCRTWELPQHMPRWYLDMGGGGHHW